MTTLTAAEAADAVGISLSTVCRFCRTRKPVGQGRGGKGYELDAVDVQVLQALHAINGDQGTRRPITTDLLAAAETAIRSRPRRWLLLTNRNGRITATTHDTAEACGPAWLSRGGVAWLIDLIPEVS